MRKLSLSFLVWILLLSGAAHALTVDEIIRLKQSGVSDSTIELLIRRGGDLRSAGVWKQDGWLVHTTDRRKQRYEYDAGYYAYPITVYPRIFAGRR